MTSCDAIIVGAGPAGCAAAYDLASAGMSVLLLDKKAFPRLKPCGGALTIKAVKRLRYSIAPVIRSVVRHLDVSVNNGRIRRLSCGQPIAVMTVRQEFDAFCLEQTLKHGARFKQIGDIARVEAGTSNVSIMLDTGEELRCAYLIGADGANSRVRKLIGGEPPSTALALEGTVPRANGSAMRLDFGCVPGGYGWVFPKGDHLNVGLYSQRDGTVFSKQDLAAYARRVTGSDRVEEMIGYPIGVGGETYRATHERILLVGDAAGMTERLIGEGIHNAIASGQAAARAIIDAAGGAAHARYQQELEPVQRDLKACTTGARWFYDLRFLGLGRLVPMPRSRALMRGFAAGKTFREIMRTCWTAPFYRVEPVAAVQEFEQVSPLH